MERNDYVPMIWAPPDKWLDEAFKGDRVIGEKGVALYVNGEPTLFVEICLSCIVEGETWAIVKSPEFEIRPDDDVKIVSCMGGLVWWKGKGNGVGLMIEENPIGKRREVKKSEDQKIAEKSAAAKAALGLNEETDEF